MTYRCEVCGRFVPGVVTDVGWWAGGQLCQQHNVPDAESGASPDPGDPIG